MQEQDPAHYVDRTDFEQTHSAYDSADYDVYYNEEWNRLLIENLARVIVADYWWADYLGDVTHRPADYYEQVVDEILTGDEHIDDWGISNVQNRRFEFDEDIYRPVQVWCVSGLEEFDCGIRLEEYEIHERTESEREEYIEYKKGESRD